MCILIMNIISCLELAQPRKYLSLPELILSGKNDLLGWEMVWWIWISFLLTEFQSAHSSFIAISQLSHSVMSDSATPWTAVRQASLSITNFWSMLESMSIKLVMPSNELILSSPLLLPSNLPSLRVFSNESVLRIRWPKYWSFSFNMGPSNEYSWLISFRLTSLISLQSKGFSVSLQCI